MGAEDRHSLTQNLILPRNAFAPPWCGSGLGDPVDSPEVYWHIDFASDAAQNLLVSQEHRENDATEALYGESS